MNIEQIISENKKGEAILASIEDGLVVFDTGLRVTGINPGGPPDAGPGGCRGFGEGLPRNLPLDPDLRPGPEDD